MDVFYFMCNLWHSLLPFYRTDHLLFICLSFSTMDTAWSVRRVSTYIRRHLLYLYLNLNLLVPPWISSSPRTTLECALPCESSPLNFLKATDCCQKLLRKPPASLVPEDALQETLRPKSFKSTLASTRVKRNTSVPNIIPNRVQSPPPPVEVDGEPEYEISEILDSKVDRRRRNCKLLYLVRWSGYEGTDDETSWLLATELGHASELVHDFHLRYPGKLRPHSAF